MDLDLIDRVVLVTGGSSGVGKATLRALYAEGALLATCARDGDRLDEALEDLGSDSERILARACDVRDQDSVGEFVAEIQKRFGRLDGLVNNAGQSRMKQLSETTRDDWSDEIDLKFSSVLNTTLSALPMLRESSTASIVNINAILAVQPEIRLITTSAARAGVLNLSKSLADVFAADRIRVNSVCLGLIDTGQWRRRFEAADTTLDYESWQLALAHDRGIALGRLGTADEVASAVTFLLSSRSSYITGSALDIGGGIYRAIH